MTNKQLAATTATLMIVSFAFGRYSVPISVKTTDKITQSDTKTDTKSTDDNTNKDTKTITTDITAPDGTKTHTVTQEQDINHDRKTSQVDVDSRRQTEAKSSEVTRSGARTNVAALGMAKASFSSLTPDYGVLVSRDVLGPINVGAFGFKSGNVGIAIGLSF